METSNQEELEVLLVVAVMYFEQHKSQRAIARRLGVSASTVSRFLGRARELGVVSIEVVPPNRDPALSERLCERLGLRFVHIAPGRADEAEPGPILAEPLASALDDARLSPGDVALLSWGRAVASVSRHVSRSDLGLIVAPAMGGYARDESWLQPNEIVRSFSGAVNGRPRFLNAPAVVSPGLAAALQAEAQTSSVMDLWGRAKVALVGIGAWPKLNPSFAAAGFPVGDPALADVVGDVAGRSFTLGGDLVPWPNDRQLLGVTPEQLRQVPHVIGLAGGPAKARAAIGAARAGLINVLVTDAPTARAIDAFSGLAGAPS